MYKPHRFFGVLLFLFISIFISTQRISAESSSSYRLTVDYGLSLENAIALGHYSLVDWKLISSLSFPPKGKKEEGKKEVVVELVSFDTSLRDIKQRLTDSGMPIPKKLPQRLISSEEVVKEMEQRGLRPATIEELLAFGAKHLDLVEEGPIAALGSSAVVNDKLRVPIITRSRELFLSWWDGDWGAGVFRFLAVRDCTNILMIC